MPEEVSHPMSKPESFDKRGFVRLLTRAHWLGVLFFACTFGSGVLGIVAIASHIVLGRVLDPLVRTGAALMLLAVTMHHYHEGAVCSIARCSDPRSIDSLLIALRRSYPFGLATRPSIQSAVERIAFKISHESWQALKDEQRVQIRSVVGSQLVEALMVARGRDEMVPPWVAYPGQDPWWGGWRQSGGERWLVEEWVPFWSHLDKQARADYLGYWNASDDWAEYLKGERAPQCSSGPSLAEHALNLYRFG